MESVLYLMADKFLEPSVLNKLKEEQEFIINVLKLGLSDADILRLTECPLTNCRLHAIFG